MNTLMLAFLVACSGGTPPVPPEAAPVVASASQDMEAPGPAAEGGPEVGKTLELRLDPDLCSYDETAGIVIFSPDSRRQAAHYTRYRIDLASLEAAAGGRPDAAVTAVLKITGVAQTSSTPSDPNMPAPDGGFQYTDWSASVVTVNP